MAANRARLGTALTPVVAAAAIAASVVAGSAIAGCGGSSTSSSSRAAAGAGSTNTAPTGSSATTTTASSSSTTSATTSSTVQSTTSSQSASVSTAPPPTPAGTPVAPAGLAQTTGYSTYELCSAHCTGAVPSSLRRTLHVSEASCGSGSAASAVTPSITGTLHASPFIGSKWNAGRVTWTAPAGFSGPILIRGGQVGGPGAVGFGEGRVPYDELQLYAAPGKAHQWQSFTRVRGPGCYAYQVDTASSSAVISFTVR